MTTPAADDFESIRRRLEELAAEKNLALTGSSAPQEERRAEYHTLTIAELPSHEIGEAAIGWPFVYAPA